MFNSQSMRGSERVKRMVIFNYELYGATCHQCINYPAQRCFKFERFIGTSIESIFVQGVLPYFCETFHLEHNQMLHQKAF